MNYKRYDNFWYPSGKSFSYESPPPLYRMSGLELRKSPGKGIGVFATRKFSFGDIVTMYPTSPPGESRVDEYLLKLPSGSVTGERITTIGPVDIGIRVGHMINDACRPIKFSSWPGLHVWEPAIREYKKSGYELANVAFAVDGSVRALRDIEQGEELVTTYGAVYWAMIDFGPDISGYLSLFVKKMDVSLHQFCALLKPDVATMAYSVGMIPRSGIKAYSLCLRMCAMFIMVSDIPIAAFVNAQSLLLAVYKKAGGKRIGFM